MKGYEIDIVKEGDYVFYQHHNGKAWLGPVRLFSVQKNSIFLFANGSICNIHKKAEVIEAKER